MRLKSSHLYATNPNSLHCYAGEGVSSWLRYAQLVSNNTKKQIGCRHPKLPLTEGKKADINYFFSSYVASIMTSTEVVVGGALISDNG